MSIRWGVIGAGGVARRRTMPAINEARDAELVALMVRDQGRADALAEEFGAKRAYGDWRALLSDPDVDAVHIATPVHVHLEQVIAAAEAGKHVMCDKPMAMSSSECRQMIDACDKAGVHLQVNFLMRFSSVHQRLRNQIAAGEYGNILEARATIFKWFDLDRGSWRVIPEQGGGGPLMDLGAHTIDLLTFMIGPISSVTALCSNRVEDWKAEDTVTVLMQAQSGAHAVVGHSFRAKGGDMSIEINGSEKSAFIATDPETGKATLSVFDGESWAREPMPWENYYQMQVEHFADCVTGKASPIATGQDGEVNLATIEAAYRSVESGKQEPVRFA
jgi:predicted dehydrogenase